MRVLAAIAMIVPKGPATGRKNVPGMTKAPQPTIIPSAIDQTSSRERYLSKTFPLCVITNSAYISKKTKI
jgi:hypothetical protein